MFFENKIISITISIRIFQFINSHIVPLWYHYGKYVKLTKYTFNSDNLCLITKYNK